MCDDSPILLTLVVIVGLSIPPASTSAQQSQPNGGQSKAPSSDALSLSVSRAVKRATQHPRALGDAEASISVAKAKKRSARAWPDPSFEVMQEHLIGSEPVLDHWAIVYQTVPVAGARARKRAGDARIAAARHQRDAARRRLAVRTRQRFYRLLALQKKRELVSRHVEWLQDRIQTLQSRPDPSAAPPTDSRSTDTKPASRPGRESSDRIDALEHQLLKMNTALRTIEASWDRRAPVLLHDIGASPTRPIELTGELLPDFESPSFDELETMARNHPRMKALRDRAEIARHRQAAGGWPQALSLSAGFRSSYSQQNFVPGYYAGVGFDLPIWSALTSGPSVEEATFEKRRAEWRRRVEQRSAKLVGLRGRYQTLRQACDEYRSRARMSLSAVTENLSSITGPDALERARRRLETRLQWLELALKTRLAAVSLNAATRDSRP